MIRTHGENPPETADVAATPLRVLTLNLAHGRGNGFHQLFQNTDTTLSNLGSIAALLKREDPHVVALQEADGPSFWSGDFDHVTFLAQHGSFAQSVHGIHADTQGLSYGTALMARLDLDQAEAITFKPTLSPVPKGFVVSTIHWPGRRCHAVDIVSIHLDFSSQFIRTKQAAELVEKLKHRNRPAIVMGDFNTDWQRDDSALRYIARELSLSPYQPESRILETFPAFAKRLDWILVSPGIEFLSHRVIPDNVSDHRGVFAELILDGSNTCQARP